MKAIQTVCVFTLAALQVAVPALFADEKARQPRPSEMGVSCGPTPGVPIFAGTCGARVTSFLNPYHFILGNNHVLTAGPPNLCPNVALPGTLILQPGTLDIGFDPGRSAQYFIGILGGAIPIDFDVNASNLVDAALVLTGPQLAATAIHNIGEPLEQFAEPIPGMEVIKNGRTTSLTTGRISAVNVTSIVSYGGACGSARFVDQVSILSNSFSGSGDSGALILRASDKAPVALLFAGSSLETLGNRIRNIYTNLGVFIDGQPPESGSEATLESLRQSRHPDPEIERLRMVQASYENELFAHPDVTAVGIGLAESGQGYAIVVSTRVNAASRVANALPRSLAGTPVRILESGEFTAR